jgi:hypothetical protein
MEEKKFLKKKVKILGGTEIELRIGDLLASDSPKIYSNSQIEMDGFKPIVMMVTGLGLYIHFYTLSIHVSEGVISKVVNNEIVVMNKKSGKDTVFCIYDIMSIINYFAEDARRNCYEAERLSIYPRMMQVDPKKMSMVNYIHLNARITDLRQWPTAALIDWAHRSLGVPTATELLIPRYEDGDRFDVTDRIEKALKMGITRSIAKKRHSKMYGRKFVIKSRKGTIKGRDFINLGRDEHPALYNLVLNSDVTPGFISWPGTIIAVEGIPLYEVTPHGECILKVSFGGDKMEGFRAIMAKRISSLEDIDEQVAPDTPLKDGEFYVQDIDGGHVKIQNNYNSNHITIDSASAFGVGTQLNSKDIMYKYTYVPGQDQFMVQGTAGPDILKIDAAEAEMKAIAGCLFKSNKEDADECEDEIEKERWSKKVLEKVKKVVSKND